jgi:hypothetical protein
VNGSFAPEAAGRSQTKPFWIYMTFETGFGCNSGTGGGMIVVGTRRTAELAFTTQRLLHDIYRIEIDKTRYPPERRISFLQDERFGAGRTDATRSER